MFQKINKIFVTSFFIILAIITLYPLLWIFTLSLKGFSEYMLGNIWGLPKILTLENYRSVLMNTNFIRNFYNSAIVTIGSLLIVVPVGAMSGFVFARYRNRLMNSLFYLVLAGMMIPVHMSLIPLFNLHSKLNLLSTYPALIGPYTAFAIPFTMFLFRSFYMSFPKELLEAAAVDGLNFYSTFFKIVFPISSQVIGTVIIFNFLTFWNEFLFALVLIQDEKMYTLPLGINSMFGQYMSKWTVVAAGLTLITIPLVLVYLIFQKSILKGVMAGAIKG
jgi:raffinose/stachyose/melibiose transport system permease protein